ncbi:MAG: NUMOD4 domain-containing protein, partial [Nanoarchaeota archaeon]
MNNELQTGQNQNDIIQEIEIASKQRECRDIGDLEGETWKNIPEYEGRYIVSNYGRVKYLSRHDKAGKFWSDRICKQHKVMGYPAVSISKLSEKPNSLYVHKLIALAFIPNSDNKSQINHKNAIKTDDRLENLEWCTPKENIQHAISIGHMDYLFG